MSELILITGPTQSGKTFLAEAIKTKFKDACLIIDEPELNHLMENLNRYFEYNGRVIITAISPEPYVRLRPNRIISIRECTI
jgi:uridine kinase